MDRAERDAFEADGFRTEAASQYGFETTNDDADEYKCTQAQLVAFAKSCERAGMYQAHGMGSRDLVAKRISELDAELAPILETERQRFLAAKPTALAPAADVLLERLRSCVDGLEDVKTLPKPYDLYYAIKNEGEGTGWTYACAGIGVTDLRELLDRATSEIVAFDRAQAATAAERIFDYADLNLTLFDACCDETPKAAHDLYNAAKALRDLLPVQPKAGAPSCS